MKKCPWCNSDIKISKKGNEYCSNICWKNEIENEKIFNERYMVSKHGDWGIEYEI